MSMTVTRRKNGKFNFNGLKDIEVRAGWQKGAKYKDSGVDIAKIAAIQEHGAKIAVPERTQTMYFKQNKDGSVGTRFVKKAKSDFSQEASVGAHTVIIPPRPFMTQTKAAHGNKWVAQAKKALGESITGKDLKKEFENLGLEMSSDIQRTIENGTFDRLADSTIARRRSRYTTKGKGGDPTKPLVDTGVMLAGITSKVK